MRVIKGLCEKINYKALNLTFVFSFLFLSIAQGD